MIVRISGEDQYRLDDSKRAELNQLDDRVSQIVESGSEDGFQEALGNMLDFVRSNGERIPDDELVGSDYILPPADASYTEAAANFTGEGLIPD
ncbi:MAG TPA: hypothetical protein VMB50_02260 [Myxococcales bacterium]|nr:hypothetical protein [Myxococcales bacterium]